VCSSDLESQYQDRRHAGRVLAERLNKYNAEEGVVVLALPRGGVPVAYEVALRLEAPLDVFIVRKLGLPGQEELAMGAIASGGVRVLNRELVSALGIQQSTIDAVTAIERRELERREREYRGERAALDVSDRTVILVDDGLATGSTMTAAVLGVRRQGVRKVVVGVPIAAPDMCRELSAIADDVVCAATPEPFVAVGMWYADFEQTTDAEVRELLEAQARAPTRFGMRATKRDSGDAELGKFGR